VLGLVLGLGLLLSARPAWAVTQTTALSLPDEPLPEDALRVGQLEVRARAVRVATEEAAFDAQARLHARIVALMRRLATLEESQETERFAERLALALKLRTLMKRLSTAGVESPGGTDTDVAPDPVPASTEEVNALAVPNGLAPEPAEWSLPGGGPARE